jgi:hypothetical protein
MPYDSCSPSKIPYGGFSPVRLQARIQPRPSPTPGELKRMTRIPSPKADLYSVKDYGEAPMAPIPRHVPRAYPRSRSRPEALGSPVSYAVSPGHRLLWPHPKLSASPTGLFASSRRVFAPQSGRSGCREAPQFTPLVSLPVPPYVPRQTGWLPTAITSPPALAFGPSAYPQHLRFPPLPDLGWLRNEAATFALCCGPVSCLLFSGKSFYFRAFIPWSLLQGTSNITIRPNSQLPEPDSHRLDKQPYGLRTEGAENAEYFRQKEKRTGIIRKSPDSFLLF